MMMRMCMSMRRVVHKDDETVSLDFGDDEAIYGADVAVYDNKRLCMNDEYVCMAIIKLFMVMMRCV